MEQVQATKKPTRDYPSYSATPWDLWGTMYARRSHRKYLPVEPARGFVVALKDTVRLALRTRGALEDSIVTVTERELVDGVKKRSYKGLANKINIWLARSPVCGFLVITLPRDDVRAERPRELPKAAVAAEDTVLWLTEEGMGTCWLGGVNDREICRAMGLGENLAVPSVVCIGRPKSAVRSGGYDSIMYLGISRRRKPLSEIAFAENAGTPYVVGDIAGETFSAAPEQKVRELLLKIAGSPPADPRVPLDLAVDSCLEAARVAPNAGNIQKWQFIVVRDAENLKALERACSSGVPWRAAVVAAGRPKSMEIGMFDKPFWMIDLPLALSHMSLMAVSMGCGSDVLIDDIDEYAVNRLVDLGPDVRTVGVLGLR